MTKKKKILCRKCSLKDDKDRKVVSGECVARHHGVLISKLSLGVNTKRKVRMEPN